MSKEGGGKGTKVKKLKGCEDPLKEVEKWIQDIWELHRSQPAPSVQYTAHMPDIDTLMEEWPPEVNTERLTLLKEGVKNLTFYTNNSQAGKESTPL